MGPGAGGRAPRTSGGGSEDGDHERTPGQVRREGKQCPEGLPVTTTLTRGLFFEEPLTCYIKVLTSIRGRRWTPRSSPPPPCVPGLSHLWVSQQGPPFPSMSQATGQGQRCGLRIPIAGTGTVSTVNGCDNGNSPLGTQEVSGRQTAFPPDRPVWKILLYSHATQVLDEEMGSERLSDLPKVTQQVKIETWTQAQV